MKQGPKIRQAATRLNNRLTIALITTAALICSPAFAINCEALIDVVSKQRAKPVVVGKTSASVTALKVPSHGVRQVVSIEDVFTFEVSADAMGFRPEKQILRATVADLQAIVQLTNGDAAAIINIAGEMAYYLETLPLTSVSEAFDVVKMRNHLQASPADVRETFQAALDIAYHPQSKNVQSFPPNTGWGVAHPHVLNLAAMHLSQKSLDLKQTRLAMLYMENSFPNAKRLHQLQALQIFLAAKVQDENVSFNAFVSGLKGLQSSLVLNRRVMGFTEIEQVRPSLEEVLMLKILAARAQLTDAELIRTINAIIGAHHPESFLDVAGIIGQGLSQLQQPVTPALN